MAADILIISLIASYCIFLIYKARKNAKEAETVVRVQAARRVRERQKIKRCRTE